MNKKRLEVELLKVKAARADLELRILERHEEIKRIENHIAVQIKREKELEVELSVIKD